MSWGKQFLNTGLLGFIAITTTGCEGLGMGSFLAGTPTPTPSAVISSGSPTPSPSNLNPSDVPSVVTSLSSPTAWIDSSGYAVQVQLNTANRSGRSVLCRLGLSSTISSATFTACTGTQSGNTLTLPLTAPTGVAASNGTMTLEVKYTGATSSLSQNFYASTSLNNVATCPHYATDTAIFTAAAQYIAAGSTTFTNASVVANPFISIVSNGTFNFSALSLRHHFVIDPSRKMLAVYLNFVSKTHGGCSMRMHQDRARHANNIEYYSFNVLVIDADNNLINLDVNSSGTIIPHNLDTNPHPYNITRSGDNQKSMGNLFSLNKTQNISEYDGSPTSYLYIGE